jgi:cell division septation protein DedD
MGQTMALKKQAAVEEPDDDDTTPAWAREILDNLRTLVSGLDARVTALEPKEKGKTDEPSTTGATTEETAASNERKPRTRGFLSAWDRSRD